MKTFDFILRFDDSSQRLTAKNGLSIKDLSHLLSSLYDALSVSKMDTLVLSEVRGNCYAINLTTNNELVHDNLKVVHKKISQNDYQGLNKKQMKYVANVKSILKDNLSLQAYSDNEAFKVEVLNIEFPDMPEHYFEISSVNGIITAIGGRVLDGTTYIRVDGINYDIKVSKDQEKDLLPYFKNKKLRLLINKRVSTEDNKIKSAELEKFEVVQDYDFIDKINEVRNSDFDEKVYELFKKRYGDID